MNRFGTIVIQKINSFFKLCSSYDRVVYEEKILVHNQIVYGNLLHLRNLFSIRLLGRREASRPSGCVLDKGSCEAYTALVCVSDGVRCTRIGNAANVIKGVGYSLFHIGTRHDLAVAISHGLNVHSLVDRGGYGL